MGNRRRLDELLCGTWDQSRCISKGDISDIHENLNLTMKTGDASHSTVEGESLQHDRGGWLPEDLVWGHPHHVSPWVTPQLYTGNKLDRTYSSQTQCGIKGDLCESSFINCTVLLKTVRCRRHGFYKHLLGMIMLELE